MSMGTVLCVRPQRRVMAATGESESVRPVGLDHPTVTVETGTETDAAPDGDESED